jgi:hypothetical protein
MWIVDKKVLGFERSSKMQGRPTSPDKVPKWPGASMGAKDPRRRRSLLGQKEEMAEGRCRYKR